MEIVGSKKRLTLNLTCGREGVGWGEGNGWDCQVWFFRFLGGGMMQVDFMRAENGLKAKARHLSSGTYLLYVGSCWTVMLMVLRTLDLYFFL